MIIVADTAPLNYLVLVGQIEILAKIYAEVLIPQTVLMSFRIATHLRRFARGFPLPQGGSKSALSSSGWTRHAKRR
jgi:hypothetical protein